MGFYIRKSISFGPLRFNLSKSGVGISTGMKGFRVGHGPRGNYVHMGVGGLYYRTTLSSPRTRIRKSDIRKIENQHHHAHEYPQMDKIESIETYKIIDSSSESLIQEINEKKNKIRLSPSFATIFIFSLLFKPNAAIFLVLFSLFLSAILYDRIRKTVVLMYDLEPDAEAAFKNLYDSFQALANSSAIWHISSQGNVIDWKRNAGAGKLLDRKRINLKFSNPPYIKSNISTPCIPAGRKTLYFFPDKIVIYDVNSVGAVSYDNLNVDFQESQFIENQSVPSDSKIVGKTWLFVNKNGGPDRRFNNNREIPIALYEDVNFTSPTGLNERIQISRTGLTQKFKENIYKLAGFNT